MLYRTDSIKSYRVISSGGIGNGVGKVGSCIEVSNKGKEDVLGSDVATRGHGEPAVVASGISAVTANAESEEHVAVAAARIAAVSVRIFVSRIGVPYRPHLDTIAWFCTAPSDNDLFYSVCVCAI